MERIRVLVALWQEGPRARILRLDREGNRNVDTFAVADPIQSLSAKGGRALFAWTDDVAHVALVDGRGLLQEQDDLFVRPYFAAVASNGTTDACIGVTDQMHAISVATRPVDRTFIETDRLLLREQYDQADSLSLVAAESGFAAAWQTRSIPRLHMAFVDAQGGLHEETSFGRDALNPQLVEQNGRLFLVTCEVSGSAVRRNLSRVPAAGLDRGRIRVGVTVLRLRSRGHFFLSCVSRDFACWFSGEIFSTSS